MDRCVFIEDYCPCSQYENKIDDDWILVPRTSVNRSSLVSRIAGIITTTAPVIMIASGVIAAHPLATINGVVYVLTSVGASASTGSLIGLWIVNTSTFIRIVSL